MPATQQAPQGAQNTGQRSFRKNTRLRTKNFGSVPISLNSTQTLFLPQIGMLAGIYVYVAATVSDPAASPSLSSSIFGPWNLIKRLRVNTNLGASTIVDCSGWGLMVKNWSANRRQPWNTTLTNVPNDPFYQYPVSLTQNVSKPLNFCFYVPIALNNTQNMALGLINLAAPQIQVSVDCVFGALADVYTTADTPTIAGNVYFAYDYWEIPPPMRNAALPANVLVRTLEQRQVISALGETTYVVPRMGKLVEMFHTVSANGALVTGGGTLMQGTVGATPASAGIDYQRFLLNQTDETQHIDYVWGRIRNRQNYSDTELPAGVLAWNLFEAMGEPRRGDFRDAYDTQAINEIDSIFSLNASVTLGSNNNFVDTVRTVVQPFQVSTPGGTGQ